MRLTLLLLFLSFQLAAHQYFGDVPEKFSANIVHKSNPIRLDEKGELELIVHFPKDFEMQDLDFDQTQAEEIQYSIVSNNDSLEQEEIRTKSLRIHYEPQMEGIHSLDLPILHFVSITHPSKKHTLYPPSIECEVKMIESEPMDDLEVAAPLSLDGQPALNLDIQNKKIFFQKSEQDLKEVHNTLLKHAPKMKWQWFLYAFGFGFLAFKLYQLLFRRKSLKTLFSTKEDPKEKALKALRELQHRKLPQKGQYEEFYVQITQIVRVFIEGYYQIKAPEQTTQEFLQVILGKALFDEQINHYLTEFLKFADLVKFAKFNPQIEDCEQAEKAAKSFILSEPDNSLTVDKVKP